MACALLFVCLCYFCNAPSPPALCRRVRTRVQEPWARGGGHGVSRLGCSGLVGFLGRGGMLGELSEGFGTIWAVFRSSDGCPGAHVSPGVFS